jgi:aerobic carbon-monoxide dehydrogenase small subunit
MRRGFREGLDLQTPLTGGRPAVQSNYRSGVRKSAKTPQIRPWMTPAARAAGQIEPFDTEFLRRSPMAANTAAVSLTVNGKPVTAEVDPRTLLVQLLRENLRLTGTHVGCDTSQCGACVVHINGKATKSCTVLALQLEGANVLTIEGLAEPDGPLHPMQEAFRENHGLQCGYCTPGMIMTAVDIVRRKGHDLDDRTIREELEGNICRCTGYHNIVKAIAAGGRAMRGSGATSKAAE